MRTPWCPHNTSAIIFVTWLMGYCRTYESCLKYSNDIYHNRFIMNNLQAIIGYETWAMFIIYKHQIFRWAKSKTANCQVLVNYLSTSWLEHARFFRLESCFASQLMPNKNVTRKFKVINLLFITFKLTKRFSRFNGVSFQTESSSTFPHEAVLNLGSYRQSPFVTGGKSLAYGLKTEIFDRSAEEWIQADDYPFANSDM